VSCKSYFTLATTPSDRQQNYASSFWQYSNMPVPLLIITTTRQTLSSTSKSLFYLRLMMMVIMILMQSEISSLQLTATAAAARLNATPTTLSSSVSATATASAPSWSTAPQATPQGGILYKSHYTYSIKSKVTGHWYRHDSNCSHLFSHSNLCVSCKSVFIVIAAFSYSGITLTLNRCKISIMAKVSIIFPFLK